MPLPHPLPAPSRVPAPRALCLSLALSLSLALVGCVQVHHVTHVPVGSQLLVIDGAGQTLEALTPHTGGYIRYYQVAPGPTAVTISRDGRRAVVASLGERSLTVIDLVNERRDRTVDLSDHGAPRGMAFLDRRSRVVVAMEGSGSVLVVNLLAARVERVLEAGCGQPRGVALARGGGRAFVADAARDELVAVDLASGQRLAALGVGRGPLAVMRRPGTHEIWVANRDGGSLTVVDGEGLQVLANVPCDGAPVGLGFDRRGRRVLVADAEGGQVQVFDAGTHQELARIPLSDGGPGAEAQDPSPSAVLAEPGGRYAFATLVHADRVAVIDLESMALIGAFPTGPAPAGLAWTWIDRFDMTTRDGDGSDQ